MSNAFALSGITIFEYSRHHKGINATTVSLAGAFLSVSLITWDPTMILIYLAPYTFYLILHSRVNIWKKLIILFYTFGVGLGVVLSVTWVFNPLFFLAVMVLMSYLLIKRDKQWFAFLWVFAIMTFVFSLWLSRWYLYPQLIIEPSIASASRKLPSHYILQSLFKGEVGYMANLYFDLLTQACTPFIIFFGSLSILVFSWNRIKESSLCYIYLITHAGFIILFTTTEMGVFQDYSATRFFLGANIVMVILASETLTILFGEFWQRFRKAEVTSVPNILPHIPFIKKRREIRVSRRNTSICVALSLLCIGSSFAVVDFSSAYTESLTYIQKVNYPKITGVLDSISWIQNNTSAGDVFLVPTGHTARVWSMEIRDRIFASLNVVKDGTAVPPKDIEMFDVLTIMDQLNASLLILDPLIQPHGLYKLEPFYQQIGIGDVGRVFPVIPQDISLQELVSKENVDAVEVIYVSNRVENKVIILRSMKISLNPIWSEDFDSASKWNVFLNGTMTSENGSMLLSTPPFCSEKVLAEYIFDTQILVSNNTLLLLKINDQDLGSYSGFHIRFRNGKSVTMFFGYPSLYPVSLGKFAGLSPSLMLTYNFLWEDARTIDETFTVSYDWLLLTDLEN